MKENKIKFLPLDKVRIIKQIILVAKLKDKEFPIGYFLYERKLSGEYKMLIVPEEEKNFTYRLQYPQDRLFPVDKIDNLILQSVKALFPNSTIKNHLIVTSLDNDIILRLTKRGFEKGEIVFHPSFANADIKKVIGKEFTQLATTIKIYNDFRKEEIKNLVFVSYFDFRDEDVLSKIREVRFL